MKGTILQQWDKIIHLYPYAIRHNYMKYNTKKRIFLSSETPHLRASFTNLIVRTIHNTRLYLLCINTYGWTPDDTPRWKNLSTVDFSHAVYFYLI